MQHDSSLKLLCPVFIDIYIYIYICRIRPIGSSQQGGNIYMTVYAE